MKHASKIPRPVPATRETKKELIINDFIDDIISKHSTGRSTFLSSSRFKMASFMDINNIGESSMRKMSPINTFPEQVPSKINNVPKQSKSMTAKKNSYLYQCASKIMETKSFENIILAIILLNTASLASWDPTGQSAAWNNILDIFELFFQCFFTLEMSVKVMYFGFGGYLKNSWNVLDVFVIICGWIEFYFSFSSNHSSSNGSGLTAIRAIRVLRTLRTFKGIPRLKVIVDALVSSLPQLFEVMILCIFIFFVFGIVGVQLFSGRLQQRCRPILNDTFIPVDQMSLCSFDQSYGFQCPRNSKCFNSHEFPNRSATSFKNILSSFLTIFQCISMEGWTDIMYMINHTSPSWSYLYFVLLIFCGSFFVLNLLVAVIYGNFTDSKSDINCRNHRESESFSIDKILGSIENLNKSKEIEPSSSSNIGFHNPFDAKDGSDDQRSRSSIANANKHIFDAAVHLDKRQVKDTISSLNAAIKYLKEDPNFGNEKPNPDRFLLKIESCCRKVVESPSCDNFVIFSIFLNTVCISAEHYGQSDNTTLFLELMNYALSTVFFLEMVIKMKAYGIKRYFSQMSNVFDALIVTTSAIEVIFSQNSGISVLRSFRLLRIFKLFKSLKSLNMMVIKLGHTVLSIFPFCVVFVLFMLLFAILGMQVFGGRFPLDENGFPPRANYDSLLWAFVTTFQIFTGENWNEVMYDGVKYVGSWTIIYFVLVLCIGKYIVLNLFLAILIDSFCSVDNEIASNSHPQSIKPIKHEMKAPRNSVAQCKILPYLEKDSSIDELSPQNERKESKYFSFTLVLRKIVLNKKFNNLVLYFIILSCITLALDEPGENGSGVSSQMRAIIDYIDDILFYVFILEVILKILALGIKDYGHDPWNLLDSSIVLISMLKFLSPSSEIPAVKALRGLRALRPLRLIKRLPGLRIVIGSIFKAIPASVNVLLIAIFCFLIFGIFGVQFFGGTFYRCSDTTRDCILLPFQRANVEHCSPERRCEGLYLDPISGNLRQRKWINPAYGDGSSYSFDNIGSAILVLFEVSTLEMWLEIMYSAVDAVGIGHSPQRNHNVVVVFYFIFFIIICNFFIMNLFMSVAIDKFNELKRQNNSESIFMTREQKNWMKTKLLLQEKHDQFGNQKRPKLPNGIRRQMLVLILDDRFEIFIISVICINVGLLASNHFGQPEIWMKFLRDSNVFFTFFFIGETVLKLYAMGAAMYFKSKWNCFDFAIVFLNFVGFVIENILNSVVSIDVTTLRAVRAARLLRLVKKSSSLKRLLSTLVLSAPSLFNVGGVLFLMLFIYAIAGMNLFGGKGYKKFITKDTNFDTFQNSMLTLFRMATGESWNAIMYDCSTWVYFPVTVTYFITFVLLVQFIMLNLFIAVILENFDASKGEPVVVVDTTKNLILDHHVHTFEDIWLSLRREFIERCNSIKNNKQCKTRSSDSNQLMIGVSRNGVRKSMYDIFEGRKHSKTKQSYFANDPKYLHVSQIIALLERLGPPIGIDCIKNSHKILSILRVVNIPITECGYMYYYDTQLSLIRRLYGKSVEDDVMLNQDLKDYSCTNSYTAAMLYAAILVQSAYRGHKIRQQKAMYLKTKQTNKVNKYQNAIKKFIASVN